MKLTENWNPIRLRYIKIRHIKI